MANYLNSYTNEAAYQADETKQYPNVSYLQTEDEVVWQTTEPARPMIIATYTVSDTTNPTPLINQYATDPEFSQVNISKMYIDDVEQQSIVYEHIFDTTGTHTVKYELIDNAIFPEMMFSDVNVTTVEMPNTIGEIGQMAFQNCTGLTELTLTENVTYIDMEVFTYCSITTMTCLSFTPPIFNDPYEMMQGVNLSHLYVPADRVTAYQNADIWQNFSAVIEPIPTV